jgi:hypothetical protein
MREATGGFLELLRRLGSATAGAAAGFLFSEDVTTPQEEQDEGQQQKSLDVPADSAEVKDLEHVRDSPIDTICQDLTESMDMLGASHEQQDEELSLTPDIPSYGEGMHNAR